MKNKEDVIAFIDRAIERSNLNVELFQKAFASDPLSALERHTNTLMSELHEVKAWRWLREVVVHDGDAEGLFGDFLKTVLYHCEANSTSAMSNLSSAAKRRALVVVLARKDKILSALEGSE
jgi:hypothetical protein